MKITETEARDLAADHAEYLARIEPIIRRRLADRGVEQQQIDAFIADLPSEHFAVRIGQVMAEMRARTNVSEI